MVCVRVIFHESLDQGHRKNLCEKNLEPVLIQFLRIASVLGDLVPESVYADCEVLYLHCRLKVQHSGHLRTVHYRIHALPADLEPDWPLDASVGEVHVSELVLRHVSVNQYTQLHILQLIAAQHLADLRKRLASMDMAFACCHLERSREILIPFRHNSSQ